MLRLIELSSNWISKLIYEKEASTDGGLQSILKIIEYYKGNYNRINIKKFVDNYYPRTNFEALIKISYENNIICNLIDKPSINFILGNNQPFIFKCKSCESNDIFLICFSYCTQQGLFIWDYRYGKYYVTIKSFNDMWDSNYCLLFFN